MVMIPRELVEMKLRLPRAGQEVGFPQEEMWARESTDHDQDDETGRITLELTHDTLAALLVLASLSVLGVVYLWNICTRQRCVCRICQNQYRQFDLLGSGGYGEVYLVDRLHDGARFVSKKIPVHNITEVDEYSKEAKELITLRHQHIVSYEDDFVHVEYGALEPKTFFIIIMEYCPEGDLKQKIEQDFNSFTEDWVRSTFSQLLQAVQYLHSKNVIHRDLKSQNVFLANDGRVRLGDFGLCRRTHTPAMGSASLTHAGTDCYMAPEMLSSSRYGKPADMWSLGCVLFEMCTGQFMWELDGILGAMVMKDANTVQQLLHDLIVPCVGSVLRSVIKRLLSMNPMARPTATICIRKKLFKRGFPLSRELFGESLGEIDPNDVTPQSVDSGSGSDRDDEVFQTSVGAVDEEDSDAGDKFDHVSAKSSGEEKKRVSPRYEALPKRRKQRRRNGSNWRAGAF